VFAVGAQVWDNDYVAALLGINGQAEVQGCIVSGQQDKCSYTTIENQKKKRKW